MVARSRRRRAEHDDDQTPSGVVGARHHIETRRAGEARLHPVCAGIAAKQTIVVGDVSVAELNRADAEEIGVVGKLAQQRPGDDRHVAGRGHVIGIVQAVGIDEMRLMQAQPLRVGVHVVGKGFDRARNAFGDHHRDIVGRLDHQHLERVVERHLGAGPEPHFRRRHARRASRHDERRIESELAASHRVQGDIDRHQLGERRRDTMGRSLRSASAPGRCPRRRRGKASPAPRRRRAPARRRSQTGRAVRSSIGQMA